MASEIKTITSESLEAAYRALTPSQSGFTQDLMASNTIIPTLDLTAAASGTSVPQYQAQAIAFGSQTAFSITNTTTALANTAGFWRIFGMSYNTNRAAANAAVSFTMTDGLSVKTIWSNKMASASSDASNALQFDFVVFLASGDSISGVSSHAAGNLIGSYRQLADVNGTVVNPSGFTPQ